MSQRTALILMALTFGIGVGVLTFFAEASYPKAVLAGVAAAATCMAALHSLID